MKHRNSFRKASHEWPASPAAYPLTGRTKGQTYTPPARIEDNPVHQIIELFVLPFLVGLTIGGVICAFLWFASVL